jgi:hypothetical protein
MPHNPLNKSFSGAWDFFIVFYILYTVFETVHVKGFIYVAFDENARMFRSRHNFSLFHRKIVKVREIWSE